MPSSYRLASIIQNTVQGEGPHTGHPCDILRFAGCNLWPDPAVPSKTCPWCDTPELHGGFSKSTDEIMSALEGPRVRRGLIITGGEPFLQLDAPLLALLTDAYEWVDIETNGSVEPSFDLNRRPRNVYVSCSPKTKNIKVKPNWWKILVPTYESLLAKLDLYAKHLSKEEFVYVQPVVVPSEQETARHVKRCMTLCTNFGFRLSLQTHKFINVP